MDFYRFSLNNSSEIEHLGGVPLPDDDAATAFGKQVIQDLKPGHEPCAGGTMLITEGERTVARIPFES
jgi:hypothetical protein